MKKKEIKKPREFKIGTVEYFRWLYQKNKSYHQKRYQENKKINTKTKCVICGSEFNRLGRTKTCSPECSKILAKQNYKKWWDKNQPPRKEYLIRAIPKKNKEGSKKTQSVKKPILTQCLKCKGEVIIRWAQPHKKYSERNNWGYYTEKKEDKDKYICEKCLAEFYFLDKDNYKKTITNEKKRQLIRTYVNSNHYVYLVKKEVKIVKKVKLPKTNCRICWKEITFQKVGGYEMENNRCKIYQTVCQNKERCQESCDNFQTVEEVREKFWYEEEKYWGIDKEKLNEIKPLNHFECICNVCLQPIGNKKFYWKEDTTIHWHKPMNSECEKEASKRTCKTCKQPIPREEWKKGWSECLSCHAKNFD